MPAPVRALFVAATLAVSAGTAAAAWPDAVDGPATVGRTAVRVPTTIVVRPDDPPLPAHARLVDTSHPDHVIGTGSPAGCTAERVVEAVAAGGVIVFDCGPDPVTITMDTTAKVFNDRPDVVLDGGGLVTLSGADRRRILYMNTCDPAQVWTTPHCQDQDHPTLTVQRIGFTAGNSTGQLVDGGGAIFVRGGRVKVLESVFVDNRCDPVGPDVGGGALRVLSQHQGRPVVIATSEFRGNRCSNGGALSSIGVSWEIHRSTFTANRTTGDGANPARPGTPGGGNGGAIALDGNRYTLDLVDSVLTDNVAGEGGGAVFFVSNDRTGELHIDGSELRRNPSLGFETAGYPGIFYLGAGPPRVTDSIIE